MSLENKKAVFIKLKCLECGFEVKHKIELNENGYYHLPIHSYCPNDLMIMWCVGPQFGEFE